MSASLFVEVRRDGPYWLANEREFGCSAIARSLDEAVNAIGYELESFWEHIACEDDDMLTADARDLKYRLLATLSK